MEIDNGIVLLKKGHRSARGSEIPGTEKRPSSPALSRSPDQRYDCGPVRDIKSGARSFEAYPLTGKGFCLAVGIIAEGAIIPAFRDENPVGAGIRPGEAQAAGASLPLSSFHDQMETRRACCEASISAPYP